MAEATEDLLPEREKWAPALFVGDTLFLCGDGTFTTGGGGGSGNGNGIGMTLPDINVLALAIVTFDLRAAIAAWAGTAYPLLLSIIYPGGGVLALIQPKEVFNWDTSRF